MLKFLFYLFYKNYLFFSLNKLHLFSYHYILFLAPLMTLLYNENNNERVVIMFELVKVSPDDIRSI